MTSDELKDQVVLVTGSSRGIGRATALAFADAGADIIVAYNQRKDDADGVVEKIRSMGNRALGVQVEISSRSSVQRMVRLALATFGRIDVLVNNAGILKQQPFLTISEEDWECIMAVNLRGAFLCAQEIFPVMQKQGWGQVINMASSGGQVGGTLAIHYSASKAAVICLTKSLARIGAPNIRVNCISPGLIDTEMTQEEIGSEAGEEKIRQIPLKRPGLDVEVAQAALFLASKRASYITGQTINVNGGLYLG